MKSTLLALTAVAGAVAAGTPSSQVLFTQSQKYAVYTSSVVARTSWGTIFGGATWLNPPIMAETFSITGQPLAQVYSPENSASFGIDMARHTQTAPNPKKSVDSLVILQTAEYDCVISAFSWATNTSSSVWNMTFNQCTTGLVSSGGSNDYYRVSDDGSTAVMLLYINETIPTGGFMQTVHLVALDFQMGTLKFVYDLGIKVNPSTAELDISDDGSTIMFVNNPVVYILNNYGQLLDTIPIANPYLGAAISDSGKYLVVATEQGAQFYARNGTNHYVPTLSVLEPADGNSWYVWDLDMSVDGNGNEFVSLGSTRADLRQIRVTTFDLASGKVLNDFTSLVNGQYQDEPTLRCDKGYTAVSSWGDVNQSVPTLYLFQAGIDQPLFNYTTNGSMFSVDIYADTTNANYDTVYLAAGGKLVQANIMGYGGQLVATMTTVPK